MRASDRLVVEAAYACWSARDLAGTLSCFGENVVFAIHVPPDTAPFMGEVHGRDGLAQRLQNILDEFDFLTYKLLQITAEEESFHSRVHFHYRHKATGLDYEGRMRHVWRVEGDQIVRFEEFHDTERVRSYFAMIEQARGQDST